MKVANLDTLRFVEGLQIESGCAEIRVKIACAAGFNPQLVTLRLSLNSPKNGTKTIIDKMSIIDLAESKAFGKGEGFFLLNKHASNGLYTLIDFPFSVTKEGALNLNSNEFLILELRAEAGLDDGQTLDTVVINALDHPKMSDSYLRREPVYIKDGITSDIALDGVDEILLPINYIDRVQITFESDSKMKPVEYTGDELGVLAREMNDVVCLNSATGDAVFGMRSLFAMQVTKAVRMVVTPRDLPSDLSGFYVYNIKSKSVLA